MSFTPNIPVSGQSLGSSRTQVRDNWASLRATISNVVQPNHIDVNLAGPGKHIFVQMPVQTSGVANLPAAGEGGMITQTVGSNSELFYARDGVATYTQLTNGNPQVTTNGYTYLPGKLLLQWFTTVLNGTNTITFASATLKNFTTVLSAQATTNGNGVYVSVTGLTNTDITLASNGSSTVYVWVLGVG